jgi:hypothetical protein
MARIIRLTVLPHVPYVIARSGTPTSLDRPPQGSQHSQCVPLLPLHLSYMRRKFGGKKGDCPMTEDVSDRLLRLPFYNGLSEVDQAYVVGEIQGFEPAQLQRVAGFMNG